MSVDLHIHTRMSDGSVGISDAITIAKKSGVKALAITDHDTFAGSGRADLLAKKSGLEVIQGAEISAFDNKRKRKVHILCYLPLRQERLTGMFHEMLKSREKAANIMLQKVMRIYPISPEMVAFRAKESTCVFKAHIMHALMDAGYADKIYGDLYRKLFYPKIGLAYAPVEYPDVFDVVNLVHEAQGLAVLAHPRTYDSFDLLHELIDATGLDGIEVYHPDNTEEDVKELLALAKKHNILVTGGSDFHGMYTSRGNLIGSYGIGQKHFLAIKERSNEKYL